MDTGDAGVASVSAVPDPISVKGRRSKFLNILKADNQLALYPVAALFEDVTVRKKFWRTSFLISHPDGIKRVLLDNVSNYQKSPAARSLLEPIAKGLLISEGSYWRRHRRIMSPAFDLRSVISYGPAIEEAAAGTLASWDGYPPGQEIDASREMTLASLAVTARALFSTDSEGIIQAIASGFKQYQSEARMGLLDIFGFPAAFPRSGKNVRAAAKAFRESDLLIADLLSSRARRADTKSRDVLDRLMQVRDEETGEGLTHREIRDEVMTIFLAGHETTALTLTWAWYLLSQHPAQEAKLHAELDAVLGGRLPTFEDVARLRYTRMVVEEVMRLFPPVYTLSRIAIDDDEIMGHVVPRGSRVAVVPWLLHRHRKHWDRPDVFDPDRFLPEQVAQRSRFSYLPFGGGPRVCIGATLAMTETVLLLASFAQRYRLRLAPDQVVEPQGLLALRPRYGMRMSLDRRLGSLSDAALGAEHVLTGQ